MSKHTPGRWVARPDPNGSPMDYCIGLDDDVSPVDYVAVCHKRDSSLIAAAPDLLEALEDALPLMGWSNMSDAEIQHEADEGNGTAPVIQKMRAAIAKARGDA